MNNKDDCLKLHHVFYLINRVMTHRTTNIKFNLVIISDDSDMKFFHPPHKKIVPSDIKWCIVTRLQIIMAILCDSSSC